MAIKPTQEQELIIAEATRGSNLAIAAFAGAAKTTTCTLIAAKVQRRSLYIAFNKSIAEEAKLKFPEWVECRTLHSLAYASIIAPEKMYKKVSGFFDSKQFVELYGEQLDYLTDDKRLEVIFKVIDILKAFCQSDSLALAEFTDNFLENDRQSYEFYLPLVLQSWAAVTSKASNVSMTHDVYLKMYQLSCPNLEDYDVIYLDECLTEKQLVKTDSGCISIKSLFNKYISGQKLPKILSFNRITEQYEYKEMLGALKSEGRETLLIKTEGLNKIECTPNHPILTQRGYVMAGDLVAGTDYILLDSAKNQKSKHILNPDQLQVVLGSYLGDGSLDKRSNFNTYRLKLTQGEAQLNYLKEKLSIFGVKFCRKGTSGYKPEATIYTNSTSTFILDDTPWNLLHQMDERALAIWYMDDGSLSNSNNVTLHSNSFSYEEHLQLQGILKRNFNLETTLGKQKEFFCLYFNKENGEKLLKLIAPYMSKELFYKNPFSLGNYVWDKVYKNYGGNFVTSVTSTGLNTVYDITVADNHNFITTRVRDMDSVGCIVHNCQDSNPVTLDVFYQQTNSQLIMVGDSYQSIYEWRGAINAFDSVPSNFKHLYLTESFRFTPEIAELGTKLTAIAGNTKQIIGKAEAKEVKTKAIICRTNASIVDYLLAATQENYKVHAIADLQDLWSKLYHLSALAGGSRPKYPNADLRRFSNFAEFAQEAEHNPDLKRLKSLAFKMAHGRGTHGNIVAIKSILTDNPEEGLFTVVTAHKSKGLEFDQVTLDQDMLKWEGGAPEELVAELKSNQTLNLLYVAVTRAKYQLDIPCNIADVISNSSDLAGHWTTKDN